LLGFEEAAVTKLRTLPVVSRLSDFSRLTVGEDYKKHTITNMTVVGI